MNQGERERREERERGGWLALIDFLELL